jgi:DNA polymerase I-like protein with 3'-5' exonuclease and polymerase domains
MRKVKTIPGTLPLFPTESAWKMPSLSELPSWKHAKRVALDTEFKSPQLRELGIGARRGDKIAGFSFMLEGHRPFYVPVRHPGPNCDVVQSFNYLRDNLSSFEGELLGANINVDLDLLTYEGIEPDYNKVVVQDVQIRDPLICELHFKYSFEAIAERYGVKGKDKNLLKQVALENGYDVESAGWMGCIASLEAKYIGAYAEQDVEGLFPIYWAQQKLIDEQGLNEVVAVEAKLLPVLLKMRQRGVRIDFDHLAKVEQWASDEEHKTVAEIKRLTNVDIGYDACMAAARVAPALRAIGIEPELTESGIPSVTTQFLATIEHPVAELIRYCRQVNKLRTTFCSSIKRYQTNGRIHSTIRQMVGASEKNEKSGAAFGRVSSAHPNIQQQPSRGKFASFWRQIYIPEEGAEWLSSDYSACEPRWTCHFSELLNLKGAKALADQYRSNSRIDPHQAMAELTGLCRKDAKTVGLGLAYGMGSLKLAKESLKLPTRWLVETADRERYYFETRKEALDFRHSYNGKVRLGEVAGTEAQDILDRFHNGAPFIKELQKRVVAKVESTGVLKVLGGRHVHFPMNKDGSFDWTFKALNRLIQCSAAYQMRLALIALYYEVPEFFLQMTIHDEADGSIWDRRVAKKVEQVMADVFKGKVPFRVENEIGPNWGQTKVICLEPTCLNFVDPVDKFGCPAHALKKVV